MTDRIIELRYHIAVLLSIPAIFVFANLQAQALIRREYTLQEIINECTNVVFGKVKSVDEKKLRAIIQVQENVKGESEYREIKINAVMGAEQGRLGTPASFIKMLKPNSPAAIFYNKQGLKIIGLGYVASKWFQLFATDEPDKDKVWWRYTHIQIYMYRTFYGSAESLKQYVRDILAGKTISPIEINVLVLRDTRNVEFPILSRFNKIGSYVKINYEQTKNRRLPDLDKFHILWIGHGDIKADGHFLNKKIEKKIRDFVQNGGVVIVSGQAAGRQHSDTKEAYPISKLPGQLSGAESSSDSDFSIFDAAGDLFNVPNLVKSGEIRIGDACLRADLPAPRARQAGTHRQAWTTNSPKYTLFATTTDGNIVIAQLKYGKGIYLVTGLRNETADDVKINAGIMENLIHYAVRWLRQTTE